jgi:recombination protein RecT
MTANGSTGLQRMTRQYESALQKQIQGGIDVRVQMAAALAVHRSDGNLQRCDDDSIMACVFEASRLGFSLIKASGEAYLVPYKDKGTPVCTLIIGYRGMIKAAVRGGTVAAIKALAVHKNDTFDFWDSVSGSRDTGGFQLRRSLGDRGNLVAVVPVATHPNGMVSWDIMSRAEIERRRAVAKASPVWRDWPEEQSLKTALRWFLKRIPQGPNQDLARVVQADYRGEQGLPAPKMNETYTEVIDVESELVAPPPSEDEYNELVEAEGNDGY